MSRARQALPTGRQGRIETLLFWSMVIASFALVFAVAVLPDCRRSLALEHKLTEMRHANCEIATRIEHLEREKQALQGDPFYIEKLARRMLNVRRPGEMVFASVVPEYRRQGSEDVVPDTPPGSVLCEVMNRLEPFATNATVRLLTVALALVNLLAAFLLFGHSQTGIPIRPYSN